MCQLTTSTCPSQEDDWTCSSLLWWVPITPMARLRDGSESHRRWPKQSSSMPTGGGLRQLKHVCGPMLSDMQTTASSTLPTCKMQRGELPANSSPDPTWRSTSNTGFPLEPLSLFWRQLPETESHTTSGRQGPRQGSILAGHPFIQKRWPWHWTGIPEMSVHSSMSRWTRVSTHSNKRNFS